MEYKYKPLDLSTQEIRLVRIAGHRAATSPTISCTIQHINLQHDTRPAYKALSYARGGTQAKEILLDGKPFHVTESVYAFLESIQDDEETLFWIDQICIDQSNIAEKNHRVTVAIYIFYSALEGVIWLGPAADDSDLAIQAIETISRSGTNPGVDLSERQRVFLALKNLFNRPYWYCLWVIQEIKLLPRIVIWCGPVRLQWSTLHDFFVCPLTYAYEGVFCNRISAKLTVYDEKSISRTFCARQVVRVLDVRYNMHSMYGSRCKQRISDIIEPFPDSKCEDPRDRVYALLSLIPQDDHVVVDYSKSLEEVVFDVWRKIKGPGSKQRHLERWDEDDSGDDEDDSEDDEDNSEDDDGDGDCDGFGYSAMYRDIQSIAELTAKMGVQQRFFSTEISPLSSSADLYYGVKTLLLSKNFDPNWKDWGGASILSWAVDYNEEEVIKLLVRTERVDVSGAAKAIARKSSDEVVRTLLVHRGSEVRVTHATLAAAAGNTDHAGKVMELLLDHRGSGIPMTEAMVKAAAANRKTGNDAMVVFLSRRRRDVLIMEETVERYVRDFDERVMEALLAGREYHIMITRAIVKAAEAKSETGNRILEVLLKRRETDVVLDEEMIEAFAAKFNRKVMKAVLRRRGAEFLITETVLLAAAKNLDDGGGVMEVLLTQKGSDVVVTDAVIEAAAGNESKGGDLMKVLFHHRGSSIPITQEVLEAAAGNQEHGVEVIKSVLKQRAMGILVTKTLVEAAARNKKCGKNVIKVLLNWRGEGVMVSEDAEAALARRFKWVGRPGH